ncbi:hypothetical protein DSM112329_00635 [Paraconexibacter sp. AEG42_29]|uniref:Uncharacterized protein n=1 Tax=Paraconexibacter sp. AEG42_29 TaxID=2997339 RepID=A0AAU7AQ56_9ACTN
MPHPLFRLIPGSRRVRPALGSLVAGTAATAVAAAIVVPGFTAAAAAAGPGGAPGAWGPATPLRYGGPASLAGNPALALNADGLGVAVSDVGGGDAPGPRSDASAFTNGVFLDPLPFSTGSTRVGLGLGGVAAYGRGGLIAAGVRARADSSQAVLALGSLSANRAQLGTVHPVGPAAMHASAPALAVNARGDAALVVPVCRDGGCRRSIIYLAVRRMGSSRITTTRIAEPTRTLPRVAAAINERGDALAVWTDNEAVNARVRTLGGWLRATQRAGTTVRGSLAAPSASLSLHRAELVGWSTQVVHEGDGTAGAVRVAQARDGGRFSAAAELAQLPALSGRSASGAVVRVDIDPNGLRHLAWTGYADGHFTVSSALLNGAADSGTAKPVDRQTLTAPGTDAVLEDLDTGADGSEVVTLRTGVRGDEPVDGHAVVAVATRASADASYTVTALSAADELATSAQTVLQPGRAIVAWGTAAAGARYAERIG